MILFVLSGLPGAGKTTRSLEIVASTGALMLCRDEIRASVRGAIDEGHLTMLMAREARFLLRHGYSVVVDSWNLEAWDEAVWGKVAAKTGAELRWEHLATPVEVCVARDATRPLSLGSDVVNGAALDYRDRLVVLAGGPFHGA